VAAGLWESLHSAVEQIKRVQWDATSDGWFGMQTAGGAYLGGSGANEATVGAYNERKLGEIHLVKWLIMDNGSLGHGIVPCGWEVDVPIGGGAVTWHGHTRWGPAWLASKHLGLRDLDSDAPEVTLENVQAGAEKVLEELRDKTAAQLGASFKVTSMTSGTGSFAGF
jgi:hypothetical protein